MPPILDRRQVPISLPASPLGWISMMVGPVTLPPPATSSVSEPEPLTRDEARRLLNAAARTQQNAAFALCLALGLRRGEVLGLRWVDVALDGQVLRIHQTLQYHNGGLHTAPRRPAALAGQHTKGLQSPQHKASSAEVTRAMPAADAEPAQTVWRSTRPHQAKVVRLYTSGRSLTSVSRRSAEPGTRLHACWIGLECGSARTGRGEPRTSPWNCRPRGLHCGVAAERGM